MNDTKKLVYSAVCTALSIIFMLISRFLPLSLSPLLAVSLCFFIALECRLIYGILCIIASLAIGFFLTAGLSLTFLFTALIFAPYSIFAYLAKKITYKTIRSALIRSISLTIILNILLAILIFCFGKNLGEFLLGLDIDSLFSIFPYKALGYIIFALVSTLLMISFDYLFIMASDIVKKRLKLNV